MATRLDLARQAQTLDLHHYEVPGKFPLRAPDLLNATAPKNARRLWPISASQAAKRPHKGFSTIKTTFACASGDR